MPHDAKYLNNQDKQRRSMKDYGRKKTKNTRPNRSCLSCVYSKREHTKTGIVVKCEISTLSKTLRIKSPWTPCEWFKFVRSARPEIDIHSRATAVFGVQKQLNKVAEECAELAAAINKYLAGECSQSKIVEEAADVKFCLGYLELWFGKKEIKLAEQKKIERLAKKLSRHSLAEAG